MANKSSNRSLHAAKATKQDEFYTQLSDIEKELRHYTKYFKNKVVLCNCDDPTVSNFFHYFSHNFEKLRLKKLITTCYKNNDADLFSTHTAERGVYLEYNGDKNDNRVPDSDEIGIHELKGDGDFRSEECVKLLKQADIVVTNPPFSLFREYLAQLVKYEKKFLIIGNQNALTYKDVFKLIHEDKIWFGASIHSGDREFGVPDHYPLNAVGARVDKDGNKFIRVKGVRWFTNLDYEERHEELALFATYTPEKYPHYDNYDAIDVSKTKEIPMDYDGAMGVPITFLDKYNPEQFEILGWTRGLDEFDAYPTKRYVNPIQVKPDGTRSNGGKVNTGPNLLVKKKPSGTYYIADNADGYLEQLYMRIIIKVKK
jgi:hypothetical protein